MSELGQGRCHAVALAGAGAALPVDSGHAVLPGFNSNPILEVPDP